MATPAPAGPPRSTVFIHGSGGDHRVWTHQTDCFMASAVLDLPGHPEGDALDHVGALADAVAHALEVSGHRGVLVGHSLGGAIAMHIALRRPELVSGLVLIGTGARLPVPEWVWESLRDDFEEECARLMRGFLTVPEDCDLPVAAALQACGPAGLAADYTACGSVELRGLLGPLTAPVLVIAGADDPLTPPWMAEELVGELPNAELVVIDGARHMPMVEAPGTVNMLIGAFMAQMDADAAAAAAAG